MVEKGRNEVDSFSIVRVGFPDQDFALELVPLGLMGNNSDGHNLGLHLLPSTSQIISVFYKANFGIDVNVAPTYF